MPNHFHLLVRIKEEANPTVFQNLSGLEKRLPHQNFSNLFNAYSKAFNKRFNRHGSLFERAFKRKIIDTEFYLKHLILYIHNNPVNHGFCKRPLEYPWSSYLDCISDKPTKLERNAVIELFDSVSDFKLLHTKNCNSDDIEKWLNN